MFFEKPRQYPPYLGDGAIIGSYSVVTKNVAPYSIVGGNPVKEIRKRFSESQIETLLKLKWWDWEIEKITRHVNDLTSGDVEGLCQALDQI